jgi:Xaa-Pro aminopeptidase
VGYVLNVHEGPQNFSQALVNQPMRPGMLTTIEPGVYLQDRYGIRTENMVVCVEDGENGDGSWRKFETYNFVPIDRDAIEPRLLLPHEKEWLNEYHQKTWDLLHTSLNPAEQEWLKEATAPI